MPNKEPYKMHPGKHSEVNPGNFKGSEVKKYAALNMHPMKYPQEFKDQKGTSDGITRADVIKARTEGYNPKMDHPQAHHPMDHKNVDGTHKAKEMPMRKSSNVINLGDGRAIANLDLRSQKPSGQKDIIVSKPKPKKYK